MYKYFIFFHAQGGRCYNATTEISTKITDIKMITEIEKNFSNQLGCDVVIANFILLEEK